MVTLENLLTYTPVQYAVISHVLTFGTAAMLAGLVYFLSTTKNVAPQYRSTNTLSAVVMASAFLELGTLWFNWKESFALTAAGWVPGQAIFSNGYRYMNWSIDVPVLLTQLLVVLRITGDEWRSKWTQFVLGGLLMIWTGYIGQFNEVANPRLFWIWGAVSTGFFLWILVVVRSAIYGSLDRLPPPAQKGVKGVWWLLFVSWWLYPVAYLVPAFWATADGVVFRTVVYTLADVTSKVVYGVMLGKVAQTLSIEEGYEPALLMQSTRRFTVPEGVAVPHAPEMPALVGEGNGRGTQTRFADRYQTY